MSRVPAENSNRSVKKWNGLTQEQFCLPSVLFVHPLETMEWCYRIALDFSMLGNIPSANCGVQPTSPLLFIAYTFRTLYWCICLWSFVGCCWLLTGRSARFQSLPVLCSLNDSLGRSHRYATTHARRRIAFAKITKIVRRPSHAPKILSGQELPQLLRLLFFIY